MVKLFRQVTIALIKWAATHDTLLKAQFSRVKVKSFNQNLKNGESTEYWISSNTVIMQKFARNNQSNY